MHTVGIYAMLCIYHVSVRSVSGELLWDTQTTLCFCVEASQAAAAQAERFKAGS